MDRDKFVRLAIATEVILLIIAGVIDMIFPLPLAENPLKTTQGVSSLAALVLGTGAGVLMSSVFFFSWKSKLAPFRRIQDFVRDQLVPLLAECKWWEVVVIAAFAGIGEEVLFRGVLQPRIGWLAATLLFGFMHPISVTYVIVAGLLGGFLGQLQILTGNLWVPIIAHALYDYVGFRLVIREFNTPDPDDDEPLAPT